MEDTLVYLVGLQWLLGVWDDNWIHKIVGRFLEGSFGLVDPHLRFRLTQIILGLLQAQNQVHAEFKAAHWLR